MTTASKKNLLSTFQRELQYFRQLAKDVKFLNNHIIQPKKKSLKRDITDIKNAMYAERIHERAQMGLPKLGRPPKNAAKAIYDDLTTKVIESKRGKKSKETVTEKDYRQKLADAPSAKGRGKNGALAAFHGKDTEPPSKATA